MLTFPRLTRYVPAAVFMLTCLLWPLPPVPAETTSRALAPGIVYTQEITTGAAPLVINLLRVDLHAPGVRVQTGQAQDVVSLTGPAQGREAMRTLAARHNALAAINADFFPFHGDPLGISIRDGEFLSEPSGYRACLGVSKRGVLMDVLLSVGTLLTPDGATLGLSGINRVPHDGDSILLTPTYAAMPAVDTDGFVLTLRDVPLPVRLGQTLQGAVESLTPIGKGESLSQTVGHSVQIVMLGVGAGSLPAHCKQGDTVKFHFDVTPNTPPPARGKYVSRADFLRNGRYAPVWTDVDQAIGGGPMLVRQGQIAVDGEAEGFGKADFIDKRHPRTAIGVDSRGCLLLVTVDGRAAWSQGASLPEMAAIMKRLGAVDAMNLDGGGSTTMVIGASVVNAPSDGRERPVADGLLLYGAMPDMSALDYRIAPDATPIVQVNIGEPFRFQVMDIDNKPVDPQRILWGTGDGLGFISQQGVFICAKPGAGTITARIGGRTLRMTVQVTPKTPPLPVPPKPVVPPLPDPLDPDDKP